MLAEAHIHLPALDNKGNAMPHLHRDLKMSLCQMFGGCTITDAQGCWISPDGKFYDEPVVRYTVACHIDNAEEQLRSLASDLKAAAAQEAIYLVQPSGRVEFI